MESPMKITIKDIAQKAGVSVATVSYVLNGTGSVSEDVSKKVRDIAEKYSYVPRSKKEKQVATKLKILVVLNTGANESLFRPYESTYFAGCELALNSYSTDMQIHSFQSDELLVKVLEEQTPDGVILISCVPQIEITVPVVSIARSLNQQCYDFVRADDTMIAKAVSSKLIASGSRSTVLVNPLPGHIGFEKRIRKIKSDLLLEGMTVKTFANEDISSLANELFSYVDDYQPDSIFITGSDPNVINLYMNLLKLGISSKSFINLYACANNLELFSYVKDDIKLLDLNLVEIGQVAADNLMSRIKRPNSSMKRHLISPKWFN